MFCSYNKELRIGNSLAAQCQDSVLSLPGDPSSILGQGTRSHRLCHIAMRGEKRMQKEMSEINFNNMFNFNLNITISNVINGKFLLYYLQNFMCILYLTAHLNSDKPHFKCPRAAYGQWLLTLLDSDDSGEIDHIQKSQSSESSDDSIQDSCLQTQELMNEQCISKNKKKIQYFTQFNRKDLI